MHEENPTLSGGAPSLLVVLCHPFVNEVIGIGLRLEVILLDDLADFVLILPQDGLTDYPLSVFELRNKVDLIYWFVHSFYWLVITRCIMPKAFGFASLFSTIVEIKSVMLPSVPAKANVPTIRLVVKVSHKCGRGGSKQALLVYEMLGKFGEVLELTKVVLLRFLNLGVLKGEDFTISKPRFPREVGAGLVIAVADFFLRDFGLVAHRGEVCPTGLKLQEAK